jgi:hypothetical protein
MSLTPTLQKSFQYYFRDFLARVQALSSDLSEMEFWSNPYPYGNSIGHLVLHLTGNLNYYIGAQLAATGYVRDREREFTLTAPPPKVEALRQLALAVEMVVTTLEQQSEADWGRAYQAQGVDDVPDRFSIFLRCAVHFHHHLGQIGYVKDEYDRRREAALAR